MRIPFLNFIRNKGISKELHAQNEIILNQTKLMEEASLFIKEIENGNLNVEVTDQFKSSPLGLSLLSMQGHLAKIAAEEEARAWTNVGLAKFSDILRNKESLDLKDLADSILKNIIQYINANQGAIFILEDRVKSEEHLQIIACYAYNRKKYIDKKIELGEGLAGQCVIEREPIYLTEIPDNYLKITSGLGASNPRSVLISPLLINEKIFGVIEIASFEVLPAYKIDFINKLSENIAASIKNTKDNEHTLYLLNASQQQAEELRAQEEEMRQNMEEMQATQEEMGRKTEEIAKAAAESESMLKGINTMMAIIEFTPEGNILKANDNFLKNMKFGLSEIQGKHHRIFVPEKIKESEEYKTFWSNLSNGNALSGIFERINANGETVFLNAIYNPILDADGKVSRVMKFATDITDRK